MFQTIDPTQEEKWSNLSKWHFARLYDASDGIQE